MVEELNRQNFYLSDFLKCWHINVRALSDIEKNAVQEKDEDFNL